MIERAYVKLSFGEMHYRRLPAKRPAPTLVLLHQTASASAMYESLLLRLAGQFELYAPDTPGFGQSTGLRGPITIERYAEALHEWADALGLFRFGLFGHHSGASIAVEMAARRPQRVQRLALSGPTLLSAEQRETLASQVGVGVADEEGAYLLDLWRRIRKKDPEAPLALSERELVLSLCAGPAYAGAYRAVAVQPFRERLARVHGPVLLLAGSEDSLYPAVDATYDVLVTARGGDDSEIERVVLDGAGTYVADRNSETLARVLENFFGRLPKPVRG